MSTIYKIIWLIALCCTNILIVNEETIVAVCFIAFMFFSFGNVAQMITEACSERSEALKDGIVAELRHVKTSSMNDISSRIYYAHTRKISQSAASVQKCKEIALYSQCDLLPQHNSDVTAQVSELQTKLLFEGFIVTRSFIIMSNSFNKAVAKEMKKIS